MFSKSAPAHGVQTQQQYQKLQEQLNAMSSQGIDPSLMHFGSPMIKQEVELDPTDPFSMATDFADFSSVLGGGIGASLGDFHGSAPLTFQTPTPGTSAPVKSTPLSSQQRRPGVHPKPDNNSVVAAAAAAAAAAASTVHHNSSIPNPGFASLHSHSAFHPGSLSGTSGHAPGAFFSMSLPVHTSASGFGTLDHATAAAATAAAALKSAGSSVSSTSSAPSLNGAMSLPSARQHNALSTSSSSTASFSARKKQVAGSPGSVGPSSVSSSTGTVKAKDGTPFSAMDEAEARKWV
ncbi:hypothetical protein HDU97_009828 [Phlyctochytrium planicorne]|nr:hypothetical protein HDU97_009828 [Phlyctochytrium planicorne]